MLEVLFLGLSLIWPAPTHGETVHRQHVAEWTYETATDRFTGKMRCRIIGRGLEIQNGLARFSFGSAVDTSDAWYRIDQGAPRPAMRVSNVSSPWRIQTLASAALNPSGGEVQLPITELLEAHEIAIRPNKSVNARTYSLAHLGKALDAANIGGCKAGMEVAEKE